MASRNQLHYHKTRRQGNGDVLVEISQGDLYGPIIDQALPRLQHTGWRQGNTPYHYTRIRSLSDSEHSTLTAFLHVLEKAIVLLPSKHLAGQFSNEIDACIAADYTFKEGGAGERTLTNDLVYTAKHDRRANAWQRTVSAERLAEMLSRLIAAHPKLMTADVVCSVPPSRGSSFSLPEMLAQNVAQILRKRSDRIIRKCRETAELKNLTLKEKRDALQGTFKVTKNIRGQRVLILDDIYESGLTIWSAAEALKVAAAAEVFGLACVKAWKDTDNR